MREFRAFSPQLKTTGASMKLIFHSLLSVLITSLLYFKAIHFQTIVMCLLWIPLETEHALLCAITLKLYTEKFPDHQKLIYTSV